MKTVTVYETDDGRRFDTEIAARKHEEKLQELQRIDSMLNPIPSGCAFLNGDGFVQQDENQVNLYKKAILSFASSIDDRFECYANQADDVAPDGYVGRMIYGYDSDLFKLWNRLMCMDYQFREWGQPYYAKNPPNDKEVTNGNT